ncbi:MULTISPECIES: hypothetical protein [unclassified Veillonella]|uniref:hypothetical protein n=1 Tax=unclassified Veillonella TaxID=2630086 RepID=UPI000F8F0943|nr:MULTISPECIES: hypothetical protein [unclassified Veillonella]
MGKGKKKKQHQSQPQQTITTARLTTMIKWMLFINHLALCWFFNGRADMSLLATNMLGGLVLCGIYWMRFKKEMFMDAEVERGMRYVLSYILMTMTAFFYTLAMYRSGELTDTMYLIITGASFFVWFCLYSATQGLIKKSE